MAIRKPLVYGKFVFTTKKEVKEKFKSILNAYDIEETLNKEDHELLYELIQHHENAVQKIGVGISHFKVIRNKDIYTNRCFGLVRIDGTETDFSYIKCIDKPSYLYSFSQVARRSIEPEIIQFRKDFFKTNKKPLCEILQTPLKDDATSHVDHIPPFTFENLVQLFIEEYAIDLHTAISPSEDNSFGRKFSEVEIEKKWMNFHNEKARLRVISQRANLSNVKIEANLLKKQK